MVLFAGPTVAQVETDAGAVAPTSETTLTPDDAGFPIQSGAVDAIAAREFLRAVEISQTEINRIEATRNRYDAALVEPLVLLGDALAELGNTDAALGAYGRALHVTRVNAGLHAPEQVNVVYREAALLASRGNLIGANNRHEYAYGVLLRSYRGDDPRLLDGIFELADWYMSTYNIFSARDLYEHANRIATTALALDDRRRLRALRGIAKTYRDERYPPTNTLDVDATIIPRPRGVRRDTTARPVTINAFARGERALIDAVKIVRGTDRYGPQDVAGAMLDLADWFLIFDKYTRALPLYRRASELLRPNRAAHDAAFATPTALYLPLPPNPPAPVAKTEDDKKEGVVEMAVSISKRGFVGRVDLLHSDPNGLMDLRARRSARLARYRPRFLHGEPQATTDVRIEYRFDYYPEDKEEPAD